MGGKIAFCGIPNKGEQNQKCSPKKGEKIRSRCLLGAQKMAEMLHHPCTLGMPNPGKQNQKWLPHPYLLGGPKEGASATQPLRSRGSPKKGSKVARARVLEKIP